MHPNLQAIEYAFLRAQQRLLELAGSVTETSWSAKPAPERWSAAECVAHLNLTSLAVLPKLQVAYDQARALPPNTRPRYRHDIVGYLLLLSMHPRLRIRTKTAPDFVPQFVADKRRSLQEFDHLQDELLSCLRSCDGLALNKVRISSSFNISVKYNAYSCFSILAEHQHRHIAQAEAAAVS